MKNTIRALFICALVVLCTVALIKFAPDTEEELTSSTATKLTNESLKQQTMIEIADSVTKQLLENAILNIVVEQQNDVQHVELLLQSNEFIDEETLLKDTYNILQDVWQIEPIGQLTLRWHMLVQNKNTEVLTLTFSKQAFPQTTSYSYDDLPELADFYEKHVALQ